MINTNFFHDIVIEDVEDITIDEIEVTPKSAYRNIVVRTKHNERVQLRLIAGVLDKLELRHETLAPEGDWLMPKVYKGKSMTELGEDHEE